MSTLSHLHDRDFRWFGARLSIAVYDTNREYPREEAEMPVEVRSLAETVRRTKDAIRHASDMAARMQRSAENLTGTLSQVDDLTDELESANAELQAAVGTLSNGGPPLERTGDGDEGAVVTPAGVPGPNRQPSDAADGAARSVGMLGRAFRRS